jgi:hypothetical protein
MVHEESLHEQNDFQHAKNSIVSWSKMLNRSKMAIATNRQA